MYPKIFVSPPHLSGLEKEFLIEAIESNWIAPKGPFLDKFEQKIKEFINNPNKYILALNSGTSAIHLALQLLGVKKGDFVICQSFTFIATANPIKYIGAEPIFIDSEKETWNMCPIQLEKAINDLNKKGKKPKAIIAVHSYGMPYNKKAIHHIANKYKIPVLEDSAEALGSKINNEFCGTFGSLSFFSFNGNKIITTSGGGALICNNKEQREEALHLATQAQDKDVNYLHTAIGYNYRMSNISASLGYGQLLTIDEKIRARRNNFEIYKKELSDKNLISFLEEPEGYFSNRWLTCVLTKSKESRDRLILALKKENIESRTLWKPLHTQPIFKNCISYVNGVSEDLYERGLCLPSGSNLTEEDLDRIISIVKKNS